MTANAKQVLFVCTGNICRSPMAEYIFRHRMKADPRWTATSAGVFAMPGAPASRAAVQALADWDIDLSPHASRPLTPGLVDEAALIAVMTASHQAEVTRAFPAAAERVRLLTSFGTGVGAPDIADPIGQSIHVYRTVRDQIDSAIADLILAILE